MATVHTNGKLSGVPYIHFDTMDVGLTLLVDGRHGVVIKSGMDTNGHPVAELEQDPECGECHQPMRFTFDTEDYHSGRKWRCPNGHSYDLYEIEDLVRSR